MSKQIKFKYPLYVVIWEDAESEVSWQEEPFLPLQPALCTSIGLLIRDEPDRILIADSYFAGTGTISNTIKIPRGMIKEMYEVSIVRKKEKKKNEKKEKQVEPAQGAQAGGHSEGGVAGSLREFEVGGEPRPAE